MNIFRRGLLGLSAGAALAIASKPTHATGSRTVRGALVHNTNADFLVPNGAYGDKLNCTFAHVEYDTDKFFDAEKRDRFIVPPGVEWVALCAGVVFEHNETGMRQGVIKKNGEFWPGVPCVSVPANKGTTTDFTTASPPIRVSPGDEFSWELLQWHRTSDGDINEAPLAARGTGTWFSIEVLS